MKAKNELLVIGIGMIIASIVIMVMSHASSGQEWKTPTLQTSEYMQGIDGDNFISDLCELHGIDPNDRTVSYQIQCPKCNDGRFLTDEVTAFEMGKTNPNRADAAFVKVTPDGSILANFYTTYAQIDKLSPGEAYLLDSKMGHTYCRDCGYPIGTDWGVYDLDADSLMIAGYNWITDPLFPIRHNKVKK